MYQKRIRLVVNCIKCGITLNGRSDSKFCSDRCRVNYNNHKPKSEAKRKEMSICAKNHYKNFKKNNPEGLMIRRTKAASKRNNIDFNIDTDDITIPKICPLLGIELQFHDGEAKYNTPSIDRINPKLGYVKGNVWIISNKANTMKQDVDLKTLKLFCSNVLLKL